MRDGKTFTEGKPNYLTTFEYDNHSGLMQTVTFPGGQKQVYAYNDQGLPIKLKLPNGITVSREYDEKHRLIRVKAQGKAIEYTYNTRAQITTMTSNGEKTHFAYDASGNLISHIDPSHRETHYAYGPFEKLIQVTDSLEQLTTYEYSSSGLHKMVLPNGSIREIVYDEYARPIAVQ